MRQFSTEAIILRRTNYGEADRILNLLTPDHGKISAIAKGVRKPKSKLAGGLELFAVCQLTVLQGRSDMGVVTSSRIKDFYGDILHDYDRMQVAYEVIKQINKATETVTDTAFYAILHDSLMYLGNLKIAGCITELWFWLQLNNLLGDGLNLAVDRDNQPLQEAKRYNFDANLRTFYAHERGAVGAEEIKLLRLAIQKQPAVLASIGGTEKLSWTELIAIARNG